MRYSMPDGYPCPIRVKRCTGAGLRGGRMAHPKGMTDQTLQGKRVAFLAAEGVEQIELTEPWKAVEAAGGTPELISIEAGHVQAFNHLDKADEFPVDHVVTQASPADFAGLVLPGDRKSVV